jgi:hypothetical protein
MSLESMRARLAGRPTSPAPVRPAPSVMASEHVLHACRCQDCQYELPGRPTLAQDDLTLSPAERRARAERGPTSRPPCPHGGMEDLDDREWHLCADHRRRSA